MGPAPCRQLLAPAAEASLVPGRLTLAITTSQDTRGVVGGGAQRPAPAPPAKHQRKVFALGITELGNVFMDYDKSLRIQLADPQKLRILVASRRQGYSRLAEFSPRCGRCGKNLVWFSDSSEESENLGEGGL